MLANKEKPQALRGAAPLSRGSAPHKDRDIDLSLFIDCGDLIVSFPAPLIERVAVPRALHMRREDPDLITSIRAGYLGLAEFDNTPYAAWDFALMLGLEERKDAWILVSLPWRGGHIPLALRTGQIAAVLPIEEHDAAYLPVGLTPSRPGIFSGAHSPESLDALGYALERQALQVDFACLWTEEDLALSISSLNTQE